VRRPTLRHRLEHLLFRAFVGGVRTLPRGAAEALGAGAGSVAGGLLRIRRSDVDRHLAIAFPERTPAWREGVARRCYRHLGREGVAMLRLATLAPEEVVRRTRVRGLDALRRALERGTGAVVVTGHLGNWEIGGASLTARGIPVDAVALRQANPLFDRDLVRTRKRLGMRVIRKHRAPTRALAALKEGRVVALLGDQNPVSGGIEVDFFGRPALTARGPATLSLRAGVPLFLGVAVRVEGEEVDYGVSLERVEVERSGDPARDARALVEAYTGRLEEEVRSRPGQYFWLHRRWKER